MEVEEKKVNPENGGGSIEETKVEITPSKRELLLQRLQREGRELKDDEGVYGAALEDMDEISGKLKGYDDANGKLVEAIGKDPRLAALLESVVGAENEDGYGFVRSMRDVYGDEIREAMDSEEMLKEMSDRAKDRLERDMANKKLAEKQDSNWAKTGDVADAWAEKNGRSQEEKAALFEKIFGIFDRLWMGDIDEALLDDFDKMLSFDAAVKEAEDLGAIKGKNAKILLERKKIEGSDELPPDLDGVGGQRVRSPSLPKERKSWLEDGENWSKENGFRK